MSLNIWIFKNYCISWKNSARLRRLRERLLQLEPGARSASRRWATEAVYRQGAFHPEQPLDIPEEEKVHLVVDNDLQPGPLPQSAMRRWTWATLDLFSALQTRFSLETW